MTRTPSLLSLGALVVLAAAVRGDFSPTAVAPVGPLNMEDQYERPRQLVGYQGHVVVVLFGDSGGAEGNRQLGEAIHVHFHPSARNLPAEKALQAPALPLDGVPPGARVPDVVALPVACIGDVPPMVRNYLRAQFRKSSPYMPVWLDFTNQMRERFGVVAGKPNMIVVDSQGRLRYAGTGVLSQEQLARLYQAITALRQEGIGAK